MNSLIFFVSNRTVSTTTLWSGFWRMIPLNWTWGFALMRTILGRCAGIEAVTFNQLKPHFNFSILMLLRIRRKLSFFFFFNPSDLPGWLKAQWLRHGGHQWQQEGIHRVSILIFLCHPLTHIYKQNCNHLLIYNNIWIFPPSVWSFSGDLSIGSRSRWTLSWRYLCTVICLPLEGNVATDF